VNEDLSEKKGKVRMKKASKILDAFFIYKTQVLTQE
jgi:hypothetical protein